MRDIRSEERGRIRDSPRARTIPVKKMTKQSIKIGRIAYPEEIVARPQTRADCARVPRPCPFVGCKYHLYLDVNRSTGSIKLNFPDIEPWEMAESCALDIPDEVGELVLEQVGRIMNVTRERIRQIELIFLEKMSHDAKLRELAEA